MDELGRRRFLKGAVAAGAVATWAAPTVAHAVSVAPVGSAAPGAGGGPVQLCANPRGTLFSDDFSGEPPQGNGYTTDYTNFVNWDVTGGAVDLLGNYNGVTTGPAVDLGASNVANGTMTLKSGLQPVSVVGRLYTLTFDFLPQGSTAAATDVAFGELPAQSLSGAGQKQLSYVATTAAAIVVSFHDTTGSNSGEYLDNIVLAESCPILG